MATILMRSLCRQGRLIQNIPLIQAPRVGILPTVNQVMAISTSKKDKSVSTALEKLEESEEFKRLTKHFENTDEMNEENYVSYGLNPGDRDEDYFEHHTTMFWTISFFSCIFVYLIFYMPDYKFRDWAKREAFLQIERSERTGSPLVNREYVDPKLIELPTDEEIGDQEIII